MCVAHVGFQRFRPRYERMTGVAIATGASADDAALADTDIVDIYDGRLFTRRQG
jgi:hypothetical protein